MIDEQTRAAADAGDIDAQWTLAQRFYAEFLRTHDEDCMKQASHWTERLAEQGHPRAQAVLAEMYRLGRGKPKNAAMAAKWLEKAADKLPDAEFVIGKLYLNGEDGKQDHKQAQKWLTRAATHGHAEAQACLGAMYLKGDGVRKDLVQAESWIRKAAEQADSVAEITLAEMYDKGEGVEADPKKAEMWLRRAADHGHDQAAKLLAQNDDGRKYRRRGDKYLFGIDIPQDCEKAVRCYTRAANAGDGDAQYTLAQIYLQGEVVPRDDKMVHFWLSKAREQDDLHVFERRFQKRLRKYGIEDRPL